MFCRRPTTFDVVEALFFFLFLSHGDFYDGRLRPLLRVALARMLGGQVCSEMKVPVGSMIILFAQKFDIAMKKRSRSISRIRKILFRP